VTGAAGVVTVATSGPAEEPYEWASVSKLLVAFASLIALEERTVDLDDHVESSPDGTTFAHLLAHASGLPFEGKRPVSHPGRHRIYSNTGIELAAAHVAARAEMPFARYLDAGVLQPLGMRSTVLNGSPAHGTSGPLSDLLLFARELLAPTLVAPETLRRATTVAFPGMDGVSMSFGRQCPCDWGLGFELRDDKRPHWTGQRTSPATFGHFGQSGAFLWVDPAAGVALASVGATTFGRWATQAWPALSDAVLAVWSGS
jgi:CubicO group peptidase (beta-lactamase class C family)